MSRREDLILASICAGITTLGFDLIYSPPRWAGGMLFFILFNLFLVRAAVERR